MSRIYIELIAGVVVLVLGGLLGWHFGGLSATNDLNVLKAQDWQGKYLALNAVNARNEANLKTAQATAAHNSEVIRDLNAKTVSTESERDMAQRLLDAARASFASAISQLSKTDDRPAVAPARQAPGDAVLRDAVAAVGAECKNNADHLDALISELKPQL